MLEIQTAAPGATDAFWRRYDRDWRSELWKFRVVWHEQTHDVVARDGDAIAGALRLRIAASLAHVEALFVEPQRRRSGIGRLLVSRAEEIANYYNCHKVSVAVFHDGDAQRFFVAAGYAVEAVIPQHTFKLDVALLRKFLL
ncbi:MAG TPA: GNAT family N-acetyltransferase [Candidatus Elarobacter sp.]|nr:GNAT family N-acetyltransferase [Candidatus Elarobacter sp.]